MTLPEAAALFWPRGPLTVTSLRTAGHEGSLKVTIVAGKWFVTAAAIRTMGKEKEKETARQAVEPLASDPVATEDLLRRIADARGRAGVRRKVASR